MEDTAKESMASVSGAIGSVGSTVPLTGISTTAPITPGAPSTAAQTSWLHFKIDNLMAKLDAFAEAEEAKAASIGSLASKYWPIAVGILIAATRLLH